MKDQRTTDFINFSTILHSAPKEYFDSLFRQFPGNQEDVTKSQIVWCAKNSLDELDFQSIPADKSGRDELFKKWFGMTKQLSELRGLSGFVAFYLIADKKDRDQFEDFIENQDNEQDVSRVLFSDAADFMRDYEYVPMLCIEHKGQRNQNGDLLYTHFHMLFVSRMQVGTKKYEETLARLQDDLKARGSKILDGHILD